MSLPKEPRQKMINIMYLVLTALLALNVSAEILNAFRTVDNSLIGTNQQINLSTTQILSSLNDKKAEAATAVKANYWYPKAAQAQVLSNNLYAYIQTLRQRILKEAEFDPAKNGDSSFKADNLDIATRIMVEEGEGKKLQAALTKYKQEMLALDPMIAAEFKNSLQINTAIPLTQDKSNKTWEGAYFRMVPTVAAITILSKFQNDVKTSENKVVSFAHEQVGKVTVRFDTYTAIVGQSSNYVMPGQEIEVMAGVGAFSKAAQPQITINGQGASLGEDGAARVKIAGGGIGSHSVPVTIRYVDQDGKPQTITKTVEYTVGQSNASIALDKMNVLYIGVDNPITVAASGGGDDKVQVSISGGGGSVSKVGPGKYNVRVGSQSDDTKITVSVDGKVAGVSQFRVRSIPDPVASVGGKPSGANVNAGEFRAQGGVGANIKDFPFDIKYSVTSFLITGETSDGDLIEANVRGNTWDSKAANIVRGVKPGQLVEINQIRAMGPDGRTRSLPSLVYYIK
jgi:gliding motility-associated protein GldM